MQSLPLLFCAGLLTVQFLGTTYSLNSDENNDSMPTGPALNSTPASNGGGGGGGGSPPGINPNMPVELDSKCKEPMESGNGTTEMSRFFYDSTRSACRAFTYSGDGGNDNNFETELDCLNDCYTGVGEGVPVREEDVIFIGQDTTTPHARELVAAQPDCLLPKDAGNCTGAIQSFYYLPEWSSCAAFKYTGCGGNANRFSSRIECEQNCLVADGSVCRGPSTAIAPIELGVDCSNTTCPAGTTCAMGFRAPECCKSNEHELMRLAYAERCESGAQAGGHFGEYFVATFATSCDDLECMPGERCFMHRAKIGASASTALGAADDDVAQSTNATNTSSSDFGFAKCCRLEAKKQQQMSQLPAKTKPKLRTFTEIRV